MRRWGIPHSPAPRAWRLGNWVALPPYRISSCAVGEMLARRPQLLGEFLALALSIARIAQFPIALRLGLEDGDIGRIASLYDHDHPLLGKSNSLFQSHIALWIWEQCFPKSAPRGSKISPQGIKISTQNPKSAPRAPKSTPRARKSAPHGSKISPHVFQNQPPGKSKSAPMGLILDSGNYMEIGQVNHLSVGMFL